MPREVAHCHLAIKALSEIDSLNARLEENTSLKSSFLLGAVSPDSAYYNISLLKKGDEYADLFHGFNSYDSFEFIKRFLALQKSEIDPYSEFFFLGVISHILLDSYWHPFIFKVTGDYNHPNPSERTNSRARHRRLETVIDQLVLKENNLNVGDFRIANFLSEVNQPSILNLDLNLSQLLNAKPATMIRTWKWHAYLQKMFIGSFGRKIGSSPFLKKEIRSLFNSHEKDELIKIKTLIELDNELIFADWIQNSINKLSQVFKHYEKDPQEFLLNFTGPSAITGRIGLEEFPLKYEIENSLLEGY